MKRKSLLRSAVPLSIGIAWCFFHGCVVFPSRFALMDFFCGGFGVGVVFCVLIGKWTMRRQLREERVEDMRRRWKRIWDKAGLN